MVSGTILWPTFPNGQIWIDGETVSTSPYDLQDTLYEGFNNLFSFSADSAKLYEHWTGHGPHDPGYRNLFFNGSIDDFIIYDRELLPT